MARRYTEDEQRHLDHVRALWVQLKNLRAGTRSRAKQADAVQLMAQITEASEAFKRAGVSKDTASQTAAPVDSGLEAPMNQNIHDPKPTHDPKPAPKPPVPPDPDPK